MLQTQHELVLVALHTSQTVLYWMNYSISVTAAQLPCSKDDHDHDRKLGKDQKLLNYGEIESIT